METSQVCAVGQGVSLPASSFETLTDIYIRHGRIGERELSSACYTWCDVLPMAAVELWRCGEAEAARVTLKAGRVTVRQFLRERFQVVTGRREYWTPSHRTPDEQDAREFLSVLRKCQ
jgi:hypothetical protein